MHRNDQDSTLVSQIITSLQLWIILGRNFEKNRFLFSPCSSGNVEGSAGSSKVLWKFFKYVKSNLYRYLVVFECLTQRPREFISLVKSCSLTGPYPSLFTADIQLWLILFVFVFIHLNFLMHFWCLIIVITYLVLLNISFHSSSSLISSKTLLWGLFSVSTPGTTRRSLPLVRRTSLKRDNTCGMSSTQWKQWKDVIIENEELWDLAKLSASEESRCWNLRFGML